MNEARTTVTVTGQAITVEGLTLHDPALAAFVAEAPEADRAALAERALRIGLLAICNANATVNLDVVKAEFERLVAIWRRPRPRPRSALETTLRDELRRWGRAPAAPARALPGRRRASSIASPATCSTRTSARAPSVELNEILGNYFDGDGSRLAHLLDPTRSGSPLHQFRGEVTDEFRRLSERITALEEAKRARAEERARGTAKGADFEDGARGASRGHGARARRPRRADRHRRRRRHAQQEGRPRHHHRPDADARHDACASWSRPRTARCRWAA